MADKNVPVGGDANFQLLYKDQGAGIYAPAVAVVSGGGSGGGPLATVSPVGEYQWNDTTAVWEAVRNVQQFTALSSLQDTTGGRNSAFFTNYNAAGVMVFIDVTAVAGTGIINTFNIRSKELLSGHTRLIAQFTGLALNTVKVYGILAHPVGGFAQLDQGKAIAMPRTMRFETVAATDGAGNNVTYSVDVVWLK